METWEAFVTMNSTIALARLTPYQNVPSARLDAAEDFLRDRDFKEGEVVFKLKPSAALSEDYSLVQLDSFSLEKVDEQPIVRAKLPQGVGVKEALAALRSDPAVEYAEPNAVYRLPDFTRSNIPGGGLQESAEPNDLDRRLWGLKNTGRRGGTEGADINAVEAWKTTIGDKKYGPLIAVMSAAFSALRRSVAAVVACSSCSASLDPSPVRRSSSGRVEFSMRSSSPFV